MVPFRKMQGLGNDFVVFDARERALALDGATARRMVHVCMDSRGQYQIVD